MTAEKNAFDARQLVEHAKAAHDAGDNETALDMYSAAVEKDPTNPDAIAGKAAMMELTGRSAAGASQLDRVAKDIDMRRQAIQYNFDTAMQDADKAIAANNFTEVRRINVGRVARNQDPQIFSSLEITAFDSRLADEQQRLDTSRAAFEASAKVSAQIEAQNAEAQCATIEAENRRIAVANLIKQSRRLTDDGKYEEALG